MWLCVPQEDTERSCKHQRRPNPRDTLCLHRLIFTANCSNLIWYAYHFWGAAGEWALGTTQTTVFTMNDLSNPKKIQHEYMEELAQLDAVIIALLLLPRWISRHSKSTWCGCLAAIFPVGLTHTHVIHILWHIKERPHTSQSKSTNRSFMKTLEYEGVCFIQLWLFRKVLRNNCSTCSSLTAISIKVGHLLAIPQLNCPTGNRKTDVYGRQLRPHE